MDNSAKSELLVPGFDTIQINYELPSAERFAQYAEWRQMPAITARELPMMRLMKTITDKSKRHVDFFDLRRVADWQEEALHLSLINESAFAWCISELRDKAADFGEKGHVRVLDTGSCVFKA